MGDASATTPHPALRTDKGAMRIHTYAPADTVLASGRPTVLPDHGVMQQRLYDSFVGNREGLSRCVGLCVGITG